MIQVRSNGHHGTYIGQNSEVDAAPIAELERCNSMRRQNDPAIGYNK
jgi:hypothetical protein